MLINGKCIRHTRWMACCEDCNAQRMPALTGRKRRAHNVRH